MLDGRSGLDAAAKALAERSLYEFVKLLWPAVEPATPLVPGRVMEAICLHLEAVADGGVKRLILNVPPGCSKSLITDVFFPAWIWGPLHRPHTRFLCASYSASLTERDNERCLRVVQFPLYRRLWGDVFEIEKTGVTKIATNKTGWKLASSVGGVSTGERADIVLIDDANSVREAESKAVRSATNTWLTEVIPTRLNNPAESAIVNIQQRTHEEDATGTLLGFWSDYTHLCLPMRYEPDRHCETSIGFSDWRREDGELLWPERFPEPVVEELERMGEYASAGQLQQRPVPRGGGIIKREWWQEWSAKETPPIIAAYAALDTAVRDKEDSDYYALTVWGVWADPDTGSPKLLLMWGWHGRVTLHDAVKLVIEKCRELRVNRLIVEDKANGWAAQQEIVRLVGGWEFGVTMFDPRRYGDKAARLISVQHLFESGIVYAPTETDAEGNIGFRAWAQMVIDEVCSFPRSAHDDLVDTSSMALRVLRDSGFALQPDEYQGDEFMTRKLPEHRGALYPA